MGGNNLIGGTTYVGGNSTSDFTATPSYGNSAYILRLSESVQYESPKFMGANVLLQASTNKKNSNTTQTNPNDTTSAALDWTFQSARLIASRSINRVNQTASSTTADAGLAQQLYIGANNLKQTETAVGGTYDFGVAKVHANYLSTILEGSIGTSTLGTQGKRTAQEVGFTAPYGKFLIKAKYGTGSSNMSAATTLSTSSITSSSYNFRGYQAGADYLMSKRTNLYALYGRASGDLSATTNYAANQVAIGVRHTF
jgi:predicted porin